MEHAGVQLGSDGGRHAGDRAESLAPGRLHPAELGKPAGHDQPCVDAGRLRYVRVQRAAGSPAAGRRRLPADVPRREAGEVPADRQLPHLRRRRRRRLQQLQRRRRHRERASARRHASRAAPAPATSSRTRAAWSRSTRSTYIFGPWGGTVAFLDTFLGGVGQWPQAVLPSRVGMEDEREGAGDVHRAEDRRAGQRDVPQPAVSRERIPLRRRARASADRRPGCSSESREWTAPTSGGRSPVAFPSSS